MKPTSEPTAEEAPAPPVTPHGLLHARHARFQPREKGKFPAWKWAAKLALRGDFAPSAPLESPRLQLLPVRPPSMVDMAGSCIAAQQLRHGHEIENHGAREEDTVMILQLLEGPQDEANLDDWLSGDLHPSPLLDTNAHYQPRCRKSGPRGTRRRRTSPWNPMFFERCVSRESRSRKNNSRWTAQEVERLARGVSIFGVGQWTLLKQKFFKRSIRTAVHLKDKWRNLLKAYQENSQKTTLLYLEPSLVEKIRELAAKQPYPYRRHR